MVSPVPPGPGWNKQRTEIPRPSSPAGTAAAECPEGVEPPAAPGGSPCGPDFPKGPIAAGPLTDASLCGKRPQSCSVRHGTVQGRG